MKYFYSIMGLLVLTVIFTSCGGNKNLQQNPPAQLQQVYYTTQGNVTKLFIPVTSIQAEEITLDSVHFRGRIAPLQQEVSSPGLYVATFTTGKEDIIMSSDPREEYENKAPKLTKKSSFDLQDHEAILEFTQNDTQRFYRLTGIEERSQ